MDINSILIVLPITKGSFILGHYLLSRNLTQEVTFFWDASHEMKHMSQDFAELEVLYDNGRGTHINNTDWSRLKMIIIPNIDILPDKPDRSFATMAKNLFGDKLKDIKFHPEVTVFFGSNFRGLIVANEFGKIFPELRKSVYVISSMFSCSRKVCVYYIFSYFIISIFQRDMRRQDVFQERKTL